MDPREKPWDKNLQLLLVLIVGFNIIPHATEVPWWVTIGSLSALGWKTLLLTIKGTPHPKRWLLAGAALLSAGAVLVQFRTLVGQEAASSLLVLLASMKLLETNRYRDAMLVIFTSYFLLMAHLLSSQSLLSTIYMGLDVMLVTTLMFQLHKHDRRSSPRSFRPAMRILAIALPVWVFLFLVFPRFSASLWNLQAKPETSVGFSDDLNPGDVESLVERDEVAFRVRFDGSPATSPENLYWRGGILAHSEGLKWNKLPRGARLPNETQTSEASAPRINYEIWLEPIFKKWLFVLDYPVEMQTRRHAGGNDVRKQVGLTFQTEKDIATRTRYKTTSSILAPIETMSNETKEIYLQLPDDLDPRVIELAQRLKREAEAANDGFGREERLSRRLLNWLEDEKFRYTKSPGTIPGTPSQQLAEFLFERKRGFCEHYAAAFATLIRAMGVPARVTIGFQGGKVNEFGSYLLVRTLDAHSWAEIWEEDLTRKGTGRWRRVDPAATIVPLRITMGGEFNLLEEGAWNSGLAQDELRRNLERGFRGLPLRLSLLWDAVQMRWNSFLLSYDFEYQKAWLEKLGIRQASRFVLATGAIVGILVFIGALHLILRRRARQADPLLLTWRTFCSCMAKLGVTRGETEGPLAFARRAALHRPESADEIFRIARAFADLRYGAINPGETAARMKDLRQSVRRFSRAARSRPATS